MCQGRASIQLEFTLPVCGLALAHWYSKLCEPKSSIAILQIDQQFVNSFPFIAEATVIEGQETTIHYRPAVLIELLYNELYDRCRRRITITLKPTSVGGIELQLPKPLIVPLTSTKSSEATAFAYHSSVSILVHI